MKTITSDQQVVSLILPIYGGYPLNIEGKPITVPDEVGDMVKMLNLNYLHIEDTIPVFNLKRGDSLLLIRDMGMGDVLMTTPVIRDLFELGIIVDFLTLDRYVPLMQNNPYIRMCESLESREKSINASSYTAYTDLRMYAEKMDNSRTYRHRVDNFRHALGLDSSKPKKLDYYISAEEIVWARNTIQKTTSNPTIAYVWEASHNTRSWGVQQHKEILNILTSLGKYNVVIFSEKNIELPINSPNIWNASGLLGIRESIAILNACDAVLTPDTGLFHAASALNKPVVTYFSTFPLAWRQSHDKVLNLVYENHVQNNTCGLYPCKKYNCLNRKNDNTPACIQIDPAVVLKNIADACKLI